MDNMGDLENPCDDQHDGIERCCEPSPLINLNQQHPQNGHPESGFVAIGQSQVSSACTCLSKLKPFASYQLKPSAPTKQSS